MRYSRAFTIPEMLAVVAITIILISLLVPSYSAAKEEGRMVVCLSNQSQIGRGTTNFVVEHRNRLPGIWDSVWVGPEEWQGCWLSNRGPNEPSYFEAAPHTGTIFPYMTKDKEVYRCPSLADSPPRSGTGSNGKFDYSALHAFAGAMRQRTPSTSYVAPYATNLPTPWIIEESPSQHINTTNLEGGFGGADRIGAWHNGNGNYVALDASAHRLKNTYDLSSLHFQAETPSGAQVSLASHGSGWGGWDYR